MKPWIARVASMASAAVRQARCDSLRAPARSLDRAPPADVKNTADIVASPAAARSLGRGNARVRLEPIAREDRERGGRMDEGEPETRRIRVGGALHHRARIDRGRVLTRRDVDVADRIADLLLEDRLRLPRHAGLRAALHEKERRLAVMNVREDRAAVVDLRLVDGRDEVVAAGFPERRLD